ncbi:hypothetical protein RRG08_009885 [Elysia crispata]|uniref:Uncharacterized protein n=1 Tax=Elysia crispata TaxID=231223 RepID=A0AAE1D9R5_9GAST|nr:hypothetical protein RRG08_009885 [Elysia crispata]
MSMYCPTTPLTSQNVSVDNDHPGLSHHTARQRDGYVKATTSSGASDIALKAKKEFATGYFLKRDLGSSEQDVRWRLNFAVSIPVDGP